MTEDLINQNAGRRHCETCGQRTLPVTQLRPVGLPVRAIDEPVGVIVCSVCGRPYPHETEPTQT